MKHLLLSALVSMIFCNYARAQTHDTLQQKFFIGLSFEPNISYRQLNYKEPNRWVQQERNKDELPKFGFTTGINLRMVLNERFSMDAALLYAVRAMATRTKKLEWVTPHDNLPIESKTHFSYHYIDIPIKLNCHFRIGKVKAYATGGFSLNNFKARTSTMISTDASGNRFRMKDKMDYGFRSSTFSVIMGFGIDIPFNTKWLFNIEPMYCQNLSSVTHDKNGKEYFFSGGINLKLVYQIK